MTTPATTTGSGADADQPVIPPENLTRWHAAIADELRAAFEEVLPVGKYTLGKQLAAFEEEFAAYSDSRHGIGISSGTAALHLALRALGVGPGDEVITVPNTYIATVFAISYINPTADMAATTMDDYLIHGPQTALDVISDITGAETIDIVGLCLGGALTAVTAAYLQQAGDSRVGALTLDSGEDGLYSAVIDPSGGYAYFGTFTWPGTVVKVRLSDFSRADVLTLGSGEDGLRSAVIDTAGGNAIFGTFTYPGSVVRCVFLTLPGQRTYPSTVARTFFGRRRLTLRLVTRILGRTPRRVSL